MKEYIYSCKLKIEFNYVSSLNEEIIIFPLIINLHYTNHYDSS